MRTGTKFSFEQIATVLPCLPDAHDHFIIYLDHSTIQVDAPAGRGRLRLYSPEQRPGFRGNKLARCIMPVGHYTRWRVTANLRNWLAFLTLRQAPNAQWEIRQYADALNVILCENFPRTMKLFNET